MTEIEKEETKNTFKIANIIKQSNISLGDTPVYAIADLLSNAGYRKQEDTVKEILNIIDNEICRLTKIYQGKYQQEAQIAYEKRKDLMKTLPIIQKLLAEQYGKEEV